MNRDKIPNNFNVQSSANEKLPLGLQQCFKKVQAAFGQSQDIVTEEIEIKIPASLKIGYIYTQGLVDSKSVQELLKELFLAVQDQGTNSALQNKLDLIRSVAAVSGKVKTIDHFDLLFESLLAGDTVILVDGYSSGFAISTRGSNERSVEEPISQSVVRGPREGFTESLGTNVALLRRRIKTSNLWLEMQTVGEVTRTEVGIMYIQGIVNEKIVEEARIRLGRIDIDGILESGNIEELIQDETYTPFPTLYNTERPDVVAAGLLEGRIAILVDGTPFVLLAPALFVQFYQSAEDYYQRADFATLIRILRYVCFFISLLAPSLYIAITTFHQELLPSSLLFSLAAQREGIPFPAFVEALIMEITFEILREAGVRLPKTVGQAVSIVGALVIGQAAVEAGLVSPAMVIVVAITAISNFVIPSFNMGISIRIVRFLLMIFAATFGLFGVTVGLILTVQHLCSLRSFGVPYMAPMAPFVTADQKDTILRLPLWGLFSRPRFISQKNNIRENNAPTTKPERKQD
jgi:spore germination protein KA